MLKFCYNHKGESSVLLIIRMLRAVKRKSGGNSKYFKKLKGMKYKLKKNTHVLTAHN